MSGNVETPTKGFTAGAAIAQFLRVKLSSAKLAVCGAEDEGIGTTEEPSAADLDKVTVRLWNAQGTRRMVAAGAITKHATVYGAASGKINDAVNGNPVGIALEAASGDGSIIEVATIPQSMGLKVRAGTATLDGSNPTPVTTGLSTIVAATVSLKATATPGDDPTSFSVGYSGGTLNIYAYKTDGTDPTLVASTNSSATVDWIAVGQ